MNTTPHIRSQDVEERWFLFDASQHVLGRMAADIATRLIEKDRPTYTPSEIGNTHVVVLNAGAVQLSGKKRDVKQYQAYSGYPGGLRRIPYTTMQDLRSKDVIKLAVRRMLPKNRLGKRMLSRLKVYTGTDHPHEAQQPVKVEALRS